MIVKLVTRRNPGAPHVNLLVYVGDDKDHLVHVGLLTFLIEDTYEAADEVTGESHGMAGAWSIFGAIFAFGARMAHNAVEVILEGDSEVTRQLEQEIKSRVH